jgi:uncharacterized SAM-binding protein YcdF (DUF218 family)
MSPEEEDRGFDRLSKWMGEQDTATDDQEDETEDKEKSESYPENRPIEPEERKFGRPSLFRWGIFVIVVAYMLVSFYHAPILARIGRYLVVEHSLEKADLIVCLTGGPVERGLAAAEAYKKGLAPKVFIGRVRLPDGNEILNERGVHYPETRDLLIMMLQGLGVPKSACITSDDFVESTIEEARIVGALVRENGYGALIIVTSPTHTRRAWLTFDRELEKHDVKIMVMPSRYSNFRPGDWWKTRIYVKNVIIEYQKLLYYSIKYFL